MKSLAQLTVHITSSIQVTLFVGLSTLLVGCGGGSTAVDNTEVYSATGSVLLNGQPAAGAWVTLAPDFEGVPSPAAQVGADGRFKITVTNEDLKSFGTVGDPAGDYFMLVRMPADPSQLLSGDKLGGAYSNPEKFKHKVQIEAGENELEPLKITGTPTSGSAPVSSD